MIIAIANTISNNNVKASSVDPDASAFFSRVTAAGGTLTTTEQTAVDTLVKSMKATGTWAGMKAIYPMVGSSAAACAQNLKSSSFTGTFSSGWTFSSLGVTGNGTSSVFDTTLIPSVSLSQNNTSVSYYIRNNYNLELRDIICTGSGSSYIGSYITTNKEVAVNDGFAPVVTPTKKNGLFTFSRILSTQSKTYCNNLQTFTNTVTSNTPNIFAIKAGALNISGSLSRYMTNTLSLIHIADGLTDTQASDLYNSVQTFQTTLSRQV